MLTAKTPQKVVKKKGASSADKLPKGSARYLPNSPEWMKILKEREEKNKAKMAKQSAEPLASGKAAAKKQNSKNVQPKTSRGRPKKL